MNKDDIEILEEAIDQLEAHASTTIGSTARLIAEKANKVLEKYRPYSRINALESALAALIRHDEASDKREKVESSYELKNARIVLYDK